MRKKKLKKLNQNRIYVNEKKKREIDAATKERNEMKMKLFWNAKWNVGLRCFFEMKYTQCVFY